MNLKEILEKIAELEQQLEEYDEEKEELEQFRKEMRKFGKQMMIIEEETGLTFEQIKELMAINVGATIINTNNYSNFIKED